MQKERPHYSLPSMMAAYWQVHNGHASVSLVPREEIDFSRYLAWEAPITMELDHYKLESDMQFISQLCEFTDPRLAILDYCSRTGHVPTALHVADRRGPATLELMRKVYGCTFQGYDWATWYTRVPCPVRREWDETLRRNLPTFHLDIIVMLDLGYSVEDTTAWLSVVEINKFPARNAAWWKKKTSRQKRSVKTRMKKQDNTLAAAAMMPSPEELLMGIDMDSVQDLWMGALAQQDTTPAAQPEETPSWTNELAFADLQIPQIDSDVSSLEEEWDPEGEQDEQALIAAALDRYGYPSSDDEG